MKTIKIKDIIITKPYRKDLGNLQGLAAAGSSDRGSLAWTYRQKAPPVSSCRKYGTSHSCLSCCP